MVKPGQSTAFALSKCFKVLTCTLISSKYSGLGLKVIEVPVFLKPTSPIFLSSLTLLPLLKSIWNSCESLFTLTSNASDRAFTTETPTPCSPPEKL